MERTGEPVPEAEPTPRRAVALTGLAALLHGAFDLATWPLAWTRPPYLRLEDMPEAFSFLSVAGVSIAASAVSGIIAGLALVAVEPAPGRRTLTLGLVLAAFWLFSALLTHAVWLSTPWSLAATSLPLALPRGLAIGWVLCRLSRAASGPDRG